MNFGSLRSDCVKLTFWRGGLIFETNCIFEYKPSPHFRLDVVHKMEGHINGHYGSIKKGELARAGGDVWVIAYMVS